MYIHEFQGAHGRRSLCGVDFIVNDDRFTVLLTELPENPGSSVTSAIEEIASAIKIRFLPHADIQKIRWIEHYPPTPERSRSYDEVTFRVFRDCRYRGPEWLRLATGSPVSLVASGARVLDF